MWSNRSFINYWWNSKCYFNLEDSLSFSYKIKVLLYDAAIVLIGVYPTDLKIPVHLKPHAMLITALFYSCQKLNVIKMSFSNWMRKQTVVYPYSEVFSDKNKWAIKSWRCDMDKY